MLGRWLAARKVQPALVYCSSARRAVETMELVLAELRDPPAPQVSRDLYLASARRLFEVVRESPDEATSILLVGHNPGIGELAVRLAGRGDAQELARFRGRFPPATFAEIGFFGESWDAVELGAGELLASRTPQRA
jgi:phosphohistidine phosphatase